MGREILENFGGTFLVVTHDRYFLDRVTTSILELSDGKLFSHRGNYTDYLLDKAERQAADAVVEHKRQMFLKKELAWVRQGPRAQRSKQKDRVREYYDEAAKDGPVIEEEMESAIPPPPQLGNRTVELTNLGMKVGQASSLQAQAGKMPAPLPAKGRYFPVSTSPLKTASALASAVGTASAKPRC